MRADASRAKSVTHFVTRGQLGLPFWNKNLPRWTLGSANCKKGTLGTPFCSYKMGLPTPRVQSERGSKKHGDVRNKTWRLPLLDSTSQVCSRDFDGPEVGGIEGLLERVQLCQSFGVPNFGCAQKFYIGWNPKKSLPTTWKVILQIHVFWGAMPLEILQKVLVTSDTRTSVSFEAWSRCWSQQFVTAQKEGSCLLREMLLKEMGMQTCPLYTCV